MDGDGVPNAQDAFPRDAKEWADMDGDGVGDNSDPDIDGDGFNNDIERKAGTDPRDKASFPDNEAPVLDFVKWSDTDAVLEGMVYDDGMGVKAVWLQRAGINAKASWCIQGIFVSTMQRPKGAAWQLIAGRQGRNKRQQTAP